MIEFVLTADEIAEEEFEDFPATFIKLRDDGSISVDFENLDPDTYNQSSVKLTDCLAAREHDGEYENRDEDWILSYEPDLS